MINERDDYYQSDLISTDYFSLNVVLVFNGNAREALDFYEKAFDVKPINVLFYDDIPGNPEAKQNLSMREAISRKLIKMAIIEIGGIKFQLLDVPNKKMIAPTEKIIPMIIDTPEKVHKYFEVLSAGAQEVYLAPAETAFSAFHALIMDKFGIMWSFDGKPEGIDSELQFSTVV